jgi:uncharacterized protein YdeI (BOF family)
MRESAKWLVGVLLGLVVLSMLFLSWRHTNRAKGRRNSEATLQRTALVLHPRMPAAEVQQMLGPPDETEVRLCVRGDVISRCTDWKYLPSDSGGELTVTVRAEDRNWPLIVESWSHHEASAGRR